LPPSGTIESVAPTSERRMSDNPISPPPALRFTSSSTLPGA
jgi:hypothetical protein